MRALLDVNVLIALLDRQHTAHIRAHAWLAQNLSAGWASCPLTENGCLRVLTNPRYSAPVPSKEVLEKLEFAKSSGHHEFWNDDVTITDSSTFPRSQLLSHQRVTDVYLLALALRHSGRLVTFDTGIPIRAVNGAGTKHLVVI